MTVQQLGLGSNGLEDEDAMRSVKTILVTGGAGFM